MPVVMVSLSVFLQTTHLNMFSFSLGLSASVYGGYWLGLSLWAFFAEKFHDSVITLFSSNAHRTPWELE